jgi:hypothetical protein
MHVKTPSGKVWDLLDVNLKLSQRARLPGARVYDLAADALRLAKTKGVPDEALFPLACPGSWLVNSPAQSVVFRRWVLDPDRRIFLDLLSLFEPATTGPLDPAVAADLRIAVSVLGKEPTVVEALSKVLALLLPQAIPLMPPLAVAFVMGEGVPSSADTFVAMTSWFGETVEEHWDALSAFAAAHTEVPLEAAQVLDRMLWFDSDGFKHFPKPAG